MRRASSVQQTSVYLLMMKRRRRTARKRERERRKEEKRQGGIKTCPFEMLRKEENEPEEMRRACKPRRPSPRQKVHSVLLGGPGVQTQEIYLFYSPTPGREEKKKGSLEQK